MPLKFTLKECDDKFWNQLNNISNSSNSIKNYISNFPQNGKLYFYEETQYIDRSFLLDYINFYSRCFDDIEKKVSRIHFFKGDLKEIYLLFSKIGAKKTSQKTFSRLNEIYLGFIIKKPFYKFAKGKIGGSIGRTILKRYPLECGDNKQRILKVFKKNHINFYGIQFCIDSLPYQEQDRAVSACATIAIWTALQALEDKFNVSSPLAPSEITSKAFESGALIDSTKYPNDGLNIYQIKGVFNKLGYETVSFKVKDVDIDFYESLIKAYIDYGIPIIVILKLSSGDNYDYHAVVISGYKYCHSQKRIVAFYVHDDQIGPYSKVIFSGNLLSWDNEWKKSYSSINIEQILIPLYPKIRFSFTNLYYNEIISLKNAIPSFSLICFLADVNQYKESLIKKNLYIAKRKQSIKEILKRQLPRFLWVIRLEIGNQPVFDLLFDATTNMRKEKIIVSLL